MLIVQHHYGIVNAKQDDRRGQMSEPPRRGSAMVKSPVMAGGTEQAVHGAGLSRSIIGWLSAS